MNNINYVAPYNISIINTKQMLFISIYKYYKEAILS